jgi:hypothetical protein
MKALWRTRAVALLALLMTPAVAPAQFNYSIIGGGITITGYTGPGGNVVIPDSLTGFTVTSIGNNVFYNLTNLTSVTIPFSVTSIGMGAFYNCINLTNVTIGNNVTRNHLTSIGELAFGGCTSLTSTAIPDSVFIIGDGAFAGCFSLFSITVDTNNQFFSSVTGVLFDKNQTRLIQYPAGLGGSYTVPNGVSSIGTDAFGGCTNLTRVTIPNSVTNFGNEAFFGCISLTNVTIPSSVASIWMWAFGHCSNLTKAYFEGNAPNADNTIFLGESGTAYYLPGASGWSSTFGGWPTALWYQTNPMILGRGYGLGATTNRFGFTISWATNAPVVIEACADLSAPVWMPVVTNTLSSGTNYFSDPNWTNYPSRFYRIRSP